MAKQLRQETVKEAVITIAADNDLSAEVDLAGYGLIGLIMPTLDNCNVTFQVSDVSGGTFVDLKSAAGNAVTVTAGVGGFAVSADDLAPLCAYRYVKIETSAVQTADRTFSFILKG